MYIFRSTPLELGPSPCGCVVVCGAPRSPPSPWMSCRVTHPPFGVGWCVVP